MDQDINKEELIAHIRTFLGKLGISIDEDPQITVSVDDIILVNILTKEPQILIGKEATSLNSMQHLLNLLFRKNLENFDKKIILDINSYRQAKVRYLKDMVKQAASKAVSNNRVIVLKPMNSFERRLVHLELINHPDIVTKSVGVGRERRVMIRPTSIEL